MNEVQRITSTGQEPTGASGGYWARSVSRRRALRGVAALSVGAAAIAACGGSSSDGGDGSGGQASGLLADPIDSTSRATKGGIVQYFIATDPPSLDPTTSSSSNAQDHAPFVYSRLLKYKPGIQQESDGEVEGDLARDWEVLDGGLRLVFHLRPDAGTDPRPPTSGRMMNAQDVVFSYERFTGLNPQAVDLARSLSPSAPVESVESPDDRTVVVRLAEPYAPTMILMASPRHLWVIPREAGSRFNPENETHGSGPWILDKHVPSSRLEYRRNPNYYNKERPFLDGWDVPIVSEAAQRLAQFRAKNIWYGAVAQQDILSTKRDLPEVVVQRDPAHATGLHHIMFGFRPGSPFLDERVRQAISMLQDRDIYMDTFYNVQSFVDEGIDMDVRQLSHLGPGWSGIWMDPRGSEFGPNAKYFDYNISEARALLSAAGYPNGFDTDWTFVAGSRYGVDWPNKNEVLAQMLKEGGLRPKSDGVDYATRYIPDYYRSRGDFDGISTSTGGSRPDAGLWLHVHYHKDGSVGHWNPGADPVFDRMLDAQMREFDADRRTAMIKDIQRYAAKLMPVVPMGGDTAGLGASWPWVGNMGVYRGWLSDAKSARAEADIHLWYDRSKQT